jgi:diguanylate cyclase (GGDEF)-like protein
MGAGTARTLVRRDLRLATQLIAYAAAGCIVLTVALCAVIGTSVRNSTLAQLEARTTAIGSVLHASIAQIGPASVDRGILRFGSWVANNRNALLDDVHSHFGVNASIYAVVNGRPIRVATSNKKGDGTRAIGVELTGAARAAFDRGVGYDGLTTTPEGSRHISHFELVRDARGRTIGLVGVGSSLDGIGAAEWAAVLPCLIALAAASALTMICIVLIVHPIGLHSALHDQLTGLPNRLNFVQRVERALARTHQPGARPAAILLLDCDRFNVVNDAFGHAAGDALIVMLARRLERGMRGQTLARLGGDEFAILLEGVDDEHEAVAFADRILTSLSEMFSLQGTELNLSASIGITLSSIGYETPDDMLRDADIAMFRAKSRGRHRHEVFHTGLRDQITHVLQLEMALRHAIDRDELTLCFQPIVALEAQRITGFEALLRWHSSEFGAVSPAEFVPVAEDSGLILKIGDWVMREACRQMRRWQTAVPEYDRLTVSVNASMVQLREVDFIERVDSALQESGLDPGSLHVEITETLLMDDLPTFKAVLEQLHERGVKIHVDDFGTGYSSLAYLGQLSVDALKIDKSFVSGSGYGLTNPEIIETIVTLARQLGVTVIAEGIETPEQERELRALGCADGQGFLFSRALEVDQMGPYLAEWDANNAAPL